MNGLSDLSETRLRGLHPDLIRVVRRAVDISGTPILVVEGIRSLPRQKKLVSTGKSTTMNSRHLTGHAVDLCALVDGELQWGKSFADQIAGAMKRAADELSIDLEWGGDWKSFVDTPHYQLSWGSYPKQDTSWQSPDAVASDDPPPAEIKAAMAKSTKHKTAGVSKWMLAATGGVTAGWEQVKGHIVVGKDIMANVQDLVASHGTMMVAGLCIVSAIVFNWLQIRQADDFKEGRYTPSGEAE